ncbi:MAG: CDGSH iron-sulfur domain-containing protein [Candidatus Nitrohelix vancouverensis]|uniref:CDGSH iron-sulfur domain-containing protein n=1 Tax=Candidatus Nitrohelix vancouverensis TaxID=2705534 RepID=A0A7T0C281_9BACT|nr:MAG: CDGSH iron-sulfur domain-containing protein [Candidatus Nitrohelix vancouverensis]
MPYENGPHIVQETPGTKRYCTCGESANKPYCDGAHSRMNTGKSPAAYEVTEAKRLVICDCGKTANSPLCDGTHSKA